MPEMALFIWGNCIIYGENMQQCRDGTADNNERHVEGMWYTSLVLIIYGYFYMLFVLIVCIIAAGAFYTYR